jgi:phage N-6-adenine-methyltransferase
MSGSRPSEKVGQNNIWLTPEWVLDKVRAYFGGEIPLDPCTEAHNPTRAARFYTEATDGLAHAWELPTFVNPPYSAEDGEALMPLWAEKIGQEAANGAEIVALLPCGARFSTGYWQDFILIPTLHAICFVRGRISFVDGKTGKTKSGQNNYDSTFYAFNADADRFCEVFEGVGSTLATRHADRITARRCPSCARCLGAGDLAGLRESGRKITCQGCLTRHAYEELVRG